MNSLITGSNSGDIDSATASKLDAERKLESICKMVEIMNQKMIEKSKFGDAKATESRHDMERIQVAMKQIEKYVSVRIAATLQMNPVECGLDKLEPLPDDDIRYVKQHLQENQRYIKKDTIFHCSHLENSSIANCFISLTKEVI